MYNNFTGTPGIEQCKFASKPDVLFYSASNLLPTCGVQSVQRAKGNSTAKPCLKRSAEYLPCMTENFTTVLCLYS